MVTATTARSRAYARLRDQPALTLLRADNVAVLGGVLSIRFAERRVLPAGEFLTELDADLAELRDNGFDLPRTAAEYLGEWVRQGILIRRPGEGREETVELSAGAAAAIAFLGSLESPRSAVTSSRLTNVSDLLTRLARDTDPDQASRESALLAERAEVDAELARVRAGDFTPLPETAAIERLEEILTLAAEIPTDFAKVSSDLETLNRELKEKIIRSTAARAEVLEEVFAGVDMISESDAGRTFQAFYHVVLDPERAHAFDQAVAEVLDRPFTGDLPGPRRHLLRELLTILQQESGAARAKMTGLSRSLRQFVQSQSWQEHQRLEESLLAAQRSVLDAVSVLPLTREAGQLTSTSIPLASIHSWRLHNPADSRTAEPLVAAETGTVDLAELRRRIRESEIDFAELRQAVNSTVREHGTASIAQVLTEHPASQGVASVIGLVVLAERYATPTPDSELLEWLSVSGAARCTLAPRFVFFQPVAGVR